jgi:hypothetical protein
MRTLTKILLPLCLLLTFAAAAAAQPPVDATSAQNFMNQAQSAPSTPLGTPPSGETICNGLVGAAHGLCTAYCDAMACDSGSPQASQNACNKVGGNFEKITGQRPPCDCPCVAQFPGFIDALNGQLGSLLACFETNPGSVPDLVVLETASGFSPAAETAPGFGVCGNFFDGALPITQAQGTACINLIKQTAAAAGIPCMPPPV